MFNRFLVLFISLVVLSCSQNTGEQASGTEDSSENMESEALFTNEIGVQPYTFRRSFPNGLEATLDTIQSMGFTEIEGGGMGLPADEYKRLCDERGLSIPAMGVGYEYLRDSLDKVVERAKVYGSKYIMIAWIPHDVGSFGIEDAQMAVDDFNRLGEQLSAEGLRLCYHNHGYEARPYEDGTLLDYIITNTNPEHVSFEMDIFWTHFGGDDPASVLRKYPDRWKLMHVKDMKEGIEKTLRGLTDPEYDVALGTGQVNVEEAIRAGLEVGVQHFFIEDESSRIIEQIPASLDYLRSLKK